MRRLIISPTGVALLLCWQSAFAAGEPSKLEGAAQATYLRAQIGKRFAEAARLQPDILPTSDGKSFVVVWKPPGKNPKRWIVSLHGTRGFATDDLAIWHTSIKNRDVGLVSLQWWVEANDTGQAYYNPQQAYREIDTALRRLNVQPGTAMLHGFSRGSANSYAVTAIDAGQGRHYFSLSVASSGGVALDFPPTAAIAAAAYGDHPLRGTRWITSAGGRDPNPDRDGIPGMRRTAAWLKSEGAIVVLSIEDPKAGHGALQLKPDNVRRALDVFLDK